MSDPNHRQPIQVGDTVRQYHSPARVTWTDAVVTCVHGNGALDVCDVKTGTTYGWSEAMCEKVAQKPLAGLDEVL
ncbi:MAG: hypothetical protein K0S48_53 [Ramlibacter sp.]|jgi:hypothetical protein|nr:hypothetical protein [Ramlibacter sp.]